MVLFVFRVSELEEQKAAVQGLVTMTNPPDNLRGLPIGMLVRMHIDTVSHYGGTYSCSSAPLGQSLMTLKEMAGTLSLERSCSVLTIFRGYGSADICVALHAYEWLRFNLASCKRIFLVLAVQIIGPSRVMVFSLMQVCECASV